MHEKSGCRNLMMVVINRQSQRLFQKTMAFYMHGGLWNDEFGDHRQISVATFLMHSLLSHSLDKYETRYYMMPEWTNRMFSKLVQRAFIALCHSSSSYTLPRKKRNFSYSISPGDPGSVSVTQGHEHYQEKFTTWPLIYNLLQKKWNFQKLRFFWGRVYI